MQHSSSPVSAPLSRADFDPRSGSPLERLVFNRRWALMLLCALLTLFLGSHAARLTVNASFDGMIPQHHPYIQNYFQNRDRIGGGGNAVRIVVANPRGDIFDPAFLNTTRLLNDEIFLLPGVDRSWMKSIWMSSVRWTEVTEEGFRGGPVMPENYDGSAKSTETLSRNIRSAGVVGSLVGNDMKSLLFVVPLLEKDSAGRPIDYDRLAGQLEALRTKFEAGKVPGTVPTQVSIIGFAKLVGDLIEGLRAMSVYFAVAVVTAGLAIFLYTRCLRSMLLVLGCSLVAVVWLLGCLELAGAGLDPYSVLVPFLVFAIGVSHGAQKMNGIMQDVGRGMHKYVAARFTFRRLFLAGVTALAADAVGFAVLMLIDIPVIKGLAIAASVGMAMLIFSNLLLLPVLLSVTGVSPTSARRAVQESSDEAKGRGIGGLWQLLDRFTTRRWATAAVICGAVLGVVGYAGSLHMQVGDLDPGAPELRSDARYNRDVAFINGHYRISSDQFVVIVRTRDDTCADYAVLGQADALATRLRRQPGVIDVVAFPDYIKGTVSGFQEGNPKWYTITRNAALLGTAAQWVMSDVPEVVDKACSTMPVFAYLADHKAETLGRIVRFVEEFARENDDQDVQFLLAAGSAGIEATTNIVVERASRSMLLAVYAAVVVLCLITFRSWRATVVAVVPLVITSLLCEALMAALGIGVKVATLPVIALGVGIGVDYALYLLSVQLNLQRAGLPLDQAYARAVQFTGKVVALVGVTLAVGVVTWIWSPIKFQADMGMLLTFMFLWNMVGALVLIPALSHFLLSGPRRGAAAQPVAAYDVPGAPLEASATASAHTVEPRIS